MILALAFRASHAFFLLEGGGVGFEVWLLNECGPNICFPKAFEQSTRFSLQKSGEKSPYFCSGNWASLVLSDTDRDSHTEKGQAGIYMHASCTMLAYRAGK